jgi:hypothetical protein
LALQLLLPSLPPSHDVGVGALSRAARVFGSHTRVLVEGRFGAGQLMSWARLRSSAYFLSDLEQSPKCGSGEPKIIAASLEVPVVECILTPPGLQARAPPNASAREQMPLQAA